MKTVVLAASEGTGMRP